MFIGDEGRRVERIGLDVFVPKPIVLLQPLVDRDKTVLADEGGRLWKILDPVEANPWVRHQNERVLLKQRGNREDRDILRDRVKSLNEIGAEIEFNCSRRQQEPVVGVGAALQDRHIEPRFFISSVAFALIDPAMLGFRKPVRRERDLIEGKRGGCYKSKSREEESETGFQCEVLDRPMLMGSGPRMIATIAGTVGGKFKFGLTPASGAL